MRGGTDQDGLCSSSCCPVNGKRAIIDHECLCWSDTQICEDPLIVGWPLLENVDQFCPIASTKTLLHAEPLQSQRRPLQRLCARYTHDHGGYGWLRRHPAGLPGHEKRSRRWRDQPAQDIALLVGLFAP